jgi:S1-C subfamily serine protease
VRLIADQLIGNARSSTPISGSASTIPGAAADELAPCRASLATCAAASGCKAGLQGATRTETVDGQAYPAGGDVVTKLDGAAVESAAELRSLIDARRPGDRIRLTVVRDGATRTVTVTLASRPDSAEQ